MIDTKNILKKQILSLQVDKDLYFDFSNNLITESGNAEKIRELPQDLCWQGLSSLTLGKCGELYARYVLEELGLKTYESLIDDHGVDMIAELNANCITQGVMLNNIKVQVKTVRYNNYTYIKKGNPDIDYLFFLVYIRVSDTGEPNAYLFPMNHIVQEMSSNNGAYHCFKDKRYENLKSFPEYGISSADKHFSKDEIRFYCIANGWDIRSNNLIAILKENLEGKS